MERLQFIPTIFLRAPSPISILLGIDEFVDRHRPTFLDSPSQIATLSYTVQVGGYNFEQLSIGGVYNARWTIFFQEIKR